MFSPVSEAMGICPAEASLDTAIVEKVSPFTVFTTVQLTLPTDCPFMMHCSLLFFEVSQECICPAEVDTAAVVINSPVAAHKHKRLRYEPDTPERLWIITVNRLPSSPYQTTPCFIDVHESYNPQLLVDEWIQVSSSTDPKHNTAVRDVSAVNDDKSVTECQLLYASHKASQRSMQGRVACTLGKQINRVV